MIATVSDVRSMSDEELRVKVAELCGWEKDRTATREDLWFRHGDRTRRTRLPDYPADLNACREFESTLKTTKEWIDYTRALFQIIEPNWTLWEAMCAQDYEKKMHILSFVVKATARQKCEAFLAMKYDHNS